MARYIDADALEDNMFVLADKMTEHGQKVMDQAIGLTRAMPTADVTEVKHGHWVMVETEFDIGSSAIYECSLCGRKIGCDKYPTKRIPNSDYPVAVSVEELFPYCHCGAKMDKVTI